MPRRNALLSHYDFIWCRTFGHAWEQWHTDKRPAYGYYEVVRCGRCGMDRYFTIDSLGQVSARRYDQPDGYKLAGDDTPDRASFRQEMRQRGFWDDTLSTDEQRKVKRRSPRKTTKRSRRLKVA